MSNLRRDTRCLIRQREPIHCYWQLCFPTLFNELHKVARHASRRSFRFLSKPVAPICELDDYKASRAIPEIHSLRCIILSALWIATLSQTLGLRQLVVGENRNYGHKFQV